MIKRTDILGRIASYLVVFLVLFQPVLFPFNILHVLSVISVIYLFCFRKELTKHISKTYLWFALLNIPYLIYVAYVAISSNTIMFGLYNAFLYVVELQVCVMFAFVLCQKTQTQVGSAIVIAGFVQAFIALICIFFPPIQKAVLNLYVENGFPDTTRWFAGKRFFGLSAQLTYTMPVVQCVVAIFCAAFAFKKKTWVINAIFITAIIFSAIINARTALILLFIGIVYLLIVKRRFLAKIPWYVYLIILGVIGGAGVALWFVSSTTFEWVSHGVKDIIALFSGEEIEGSYFSALFSRFIFFPDNVTDLFLGNGINIFSGGVLDQRSDVGYIVDLWYSGIVGCLLKYLPCIFALGKVGRKNHFAWFLLAIIAVVNIKGVAFENNELMAFTSLFILLASCEQQNARIGSENLG